MTAMTISDLRPAGHALLADSEGFISDLSDEELGIRGAFHVSHGFKQASLSTSASASDSGYSDSASASDSGYSDSASASDSGYSASASFSGHYPMPKFQKASCL